MWFTSYVSPSTLVVEPLTTLSAIKCSNLCHNVVVTHKARGRSVSQNYCTAHTTRHFESQTVVVMLVCGCTTYTKLIPGEVITRLFQVERSVTGANNHSMQRKHVGSLCVCMCVCACLLPPVSCCALCGYYSSSCKNSVQGGPTTSVFGYDKIKKILCVLTVQEEVQMCLSTT